MAHIGIYIFPMHVSLVVCLLMLICADCVRECIYRYDAHEVLGMVGPHAMPNRVRNGIVMNVNVVVVQCH